MLRVRNDAAPLDYRLCSQTVTLYHLTGKGSAYGCARTVFRGAYLEAEQTGGTDKTGATGQQGFLLVLPSGFGGRPVWGEHYTLSPGDKVLLGEGPELTAREDWQAMLPAVRNDLFVVRRVAVRHWQGSVCHAEVRG